MATNIKAGLHKIKNECFVVCRDKPSLSTKVDISNLNFDVKCLNLTDAHSHTADSQARWESDNDRVQRRPLYPAFFSTIFKIGELPDLPDISFPYLFSRVNVACMLPG